MSHCIDGWHAPVCEMLVRMFDSRCGPPILVIRNGSVIEAATGRCLTPSEYTDMAERLLDAAESAEDERDNQD